MVHGVNLPVSIAQAQGAALRVIDYRTRAMTSTAAVDGICSVTFEPVPPGQFWLVDRLIVSSTSTTPTVARIYTDQATADRLQNATPAGNLDVDDSNSPLMVDSASALLVQWSGASPGTTGTARIQYRIMRRS